MSEIFDVVWEMVLSLPTHEVKQSALAEKVHKLAYAALLDPSQQQLHNHYIRAASGLLGPILKKIDKIILKETVMAEPGDNGDEVPGGNEDEDEDLDPCYYPLM